MELTDPLLGSNVPIFNPRRDDWHEHFDWKDSGRLIVGLSALGRATVEGLRLNDEYHIAARDSWIAAGRYPPE